MNRRTTSLALAAGIPGALLGATTVLAQQGQGLQELKGPVEIPVTGDLFAATNPQQKVGTFEGVLTNAKLAAAPDPSQKPTLTGQLSGTATGTDGKKDKLDARPVSGTLTPAASAAAEGAVLPAVALAQTAPACSILFLDLQPLTLNLLGLQVLLSRVTLLINAIPGAGNLLGNLLCAVVNLLNPGSGLLGNAILAGILAGLVGALNDLLGGLLAAGGSGSTA